MSTTADGRRVDKPDDNLVCVGFALDAVCRLCLGAEGWRVEVLLGDEPVVDAASTAWAADWARHEQVA